MRIQPGFVAPPIAHVKESWTARPHFTFSPPRYLNDLWNIPREDSRHTHQIESVQKQPWIAAKLANVIAPRTEPRSELGSAKVVHGMAGVDNGSTHVLRRRFVYFFAVFVLLYGEGLDAVADHRQH